MTPRLALEFIEGEQPCYHINVQVGSREWGTCDDCGKENISLDPAKVAKRKDSDEKFDLAIEVFRALVEKSEAESLAPAPKAKKLSNFANLGEELAYLTNRYEDKQEASRNEARKKFEKEKKLYLSGLVKELKLRAKSSNTRAYVLSYKPAHYKCVWVIEFCKANGLEYSLTEEDTVTLTITW